jgi:hypothetical protein
MSWYIGRNLLLSKAHTLDFLQNAGRFCAARQAAEFWPPRPTTTLPQSHDASVAISLRTRSTNRYQLGVNCDRLIEQSSDPSVWFPAQFRTLASSHPQ